MSMTPYNGDINQSLKWLQNLAPGIQGIIQRKANWYGLYHKQFWSGWFSSVFDLRTANPFGLMVWCIILGVPSAPFGLYPTGNGWGFGPLRQNFIFSDTVPTLPDPNLIGGNFYGGGNSEILNLDEVRWALQLRYVTLVCGGNVKFINRMLRYIFNKDLPWSGNRYFYVADVTNTTAPTAAQRIVELRVGPGMGLSTQLINVLNDPTMGVTPSVCGAKTTVVQE